MDLPTIQRDSLSPLLAYARRAREALPIGQLLASTAWVFVGGIVALAAVAALLQRPTADAAVAAVVLLQAAGVGVMVLARQRTVALLGLGMACAAPFVFPAAAPAWLAIVACVWPVVALLVLPQAAQRVAALAGLGWALPTMHATFGYEGLGYAVPLVLTLGVAVAVWRREAAPVWPAAALYLAIVLALGYA